LCILAIFARPTSKLSLLPPDISLADCSLFLHLLSSFSVLSVLTLLALETFFSHSPESFSSSAHCIYKAYSNFELVNYGSDGAFDATRGSNPHCERWPTAITTCGHGEDVDELEESVGGICEGEETE